MTTIELDKFNNINLTLSTSDVDKIVNIIKLLLPTDKGIMLINLDKNIVETVSEKLNIPLEYYFNHEDKEYYFIRNKATSPRVFNDSIYSSMCFLTYKGNSIYIKDKSKPFETFIGGTAEKNEVLQDTVLYKNILARELCEETNGGIILNDDIETPIIATIKFSSTLFGKSGISDTCKVMRLHCEDGIFLKNLLNEHNRIQPGLYKSKMEYNSEIEYVSMWELPSKNVQINNLESEDYNKLEQLMNIIKEIKSTLKLNISNMSMFITLIFHWKLVNKPISFNDSQKLKKLGFPPTIKSINF